MRAIIVVGPRPEGVKCAPVILALSDPVVVTTGQHDISGTLAAFGIEADYAYSIRGDVVAETMTNVLDAIGRSRPDVVIVEGDTSSTLGGALAGFQAGIPVAHVEAGLRTGDLASPWPEEGWRRMVSQVAAYNFAPTETAAGHLYRELVPGEVHVTGNTVVDALRISGIERGGDGPGILVELHRRESIGAPLREAMSAVAELAGRYDVTVLAHPNPAVREIVTETFPRARDPLPYFDFIKLLASSRLVLSDSGGLQEECSALGVPMLVAREASERPEAVECGASRLVGTSYRKILDEVARLDDPAAYAAMASAGCPYGDGHAADIIADILEERCASEKRPA